MSGGWAFVIYLLIGVPFAWWVSRLVRQDLMPPDNPSYKFGLDDFFVIGMMFVVGVFLWPLALIGKVVGR